MKLANFLKKAGMRNAKASCNDTATSFLVPNASYPYQLYQPKIPAKLRENTGK